MARLLLVEDHTIVRSGIRALLESSGLEVLAEAADGREAVRLVTETAPDVVLMDIAMPRLNGIEAAREILAARPDVKVIVLTMHGEEQYVYEALHAGVSGYVLKESAFSELVSAINTVLGGRTYLSPALAGVVADDYVRRARGERGPSALEKLSSRERQVLQLVAEGHSSPEIGKLLHISARTVDAHRLHLMEKLQLRNIAELTKFAIRHGVASI